MKSGDWSSSVRGSRRGFFWQDWYAAVAMLRCWACPAEGVLAIEVEAAGAQHVDDVVVYGSDVVAYQQLKHTVSTSRRFTGSMLFSDREGPPLIRKLFVGWQRVSTASTKPVEVHLVTNAPASRASNNLIMSPATFAESVVVPVREGAWNDSSPLAPAVQKIRALAGQPEEATFLSFLAVLRFKFRGTRNGRASAGVGGAAPRATSPQRGCRCKRVG